MRRRDTPPGRTVSARVVPWLPAGVTAAMLVASIVLDLVSPRTGVGADLSLGYGWSYTLLGFSVCVLAGVVLHERRGARWGWLLAAFGLFWSLDGLAQSWVRWSVRADEVLAGANLALWFLNRVGAFLPVTVAVLLMLFPNGRFVTGWPGRVCMTSLGLGVTGASTFLVLAAPAGAFTDEVPDGVDLNAFSLGLSEDLSRAVQPVGVTFLLQSVIVGMFSVVVRYRRAEGEDRDRMRWLLWAVLVMLLFVVLSSVVEAQPMRDATLFVLTLLPAAAMTVGVVRPDLVPVQDLVARTIVLGGVGLLLIGIDLAVVAGFTALVGERLDPQQVVVLALLLTVTLYAPLRSRLNHVVRRWILGEREAPYDVVAGLASALERADEGPEQLAAVAGAVAAAFGVGFVRVEVERGGGERLIATHGEAPAQVRSLPITYRGEDVGEILLPARGVRSRLSHRDEQLLADLVRQAATAARTSRLADELQDSRERLVVAREEERRRIRRDLHDGLGPAMAGVVFQVESARLLVDRDPERARAQLADTAAHVQEVVADVRRLVHDLRPPALDDRGLAGAVRQLTETLPLPVTVETGDGLDHLPAAVEVAAYRILSEALANVVRHAGATRADARLERTADALVVSVRDDGRGIPVEVEAGVGMLSLRERAAELGGRTAVSCPPEGGTLVRAWLPVRPSDPPSPSTDEGGPRDRLDP